MKRMNTVYRELISDMVLNGGNVRVKNALKFQTASLPFIRRLV